MKATKKEIIKALATEPLAGGQWINGIKCRSCAIGSFMKSHFEIDEDVSNFCAEIVTYCQFSAHLDSDHILWENKLIEMINDSLYLSALSSYFERITINRAQRIPTDEDIFELINFVEAEFPDAIDLKWCSIL